MAHDVSSVAMFFVVFPTNVIISHSTKNNTNYLSYDVNVTKYDLVTHTELYSNKIVSYYI